MKASAQLQKIVFRLILERFRDSHFTDRIRIDNP